MEHAEHPHPLATRIAHWTNALVMAVMLWSGFAMLVADRHYAAAIRLLPPSFWNALQLTGHRLEGRAWHLGVALVLIANGLFYAAVSLRTGAWRRIVPGFSQGEYHPPQRVAYTGVMAMGALMVLTGCALWFKRQVPWLLMLLGGERIATAIHVVLACAFVAFILVHVVQVLRAGLPTLLAMVVGEGSARRGIAWVAATAVALGAGFTAVHDTSGPTGVPTFLRWTVEREHGRGAMGRSRHHHRAEASAITDDE
jgi:thiosulfate reductase cytochrome b subunit